MTEKAKKIIIAAGSAVAAIGVLLIIYFLNKDSIDNWFRLKTMDEKEYCDMIADEFVDILCDKVLIAGRYAPELSDTVYVGVEAMVNDAVSSELGFDNQIRMWAEGDASLKDGVLSGDLMLSYCDKKIDPVELTKIDLTVDLPEKRTFVKVPRFSPEVLELTSLYGDQIENLLKQVAPIIDVEKTVKDLIAAFGGVSGTRELFERIRAARKSVSLETDETFWGIGVKEGRDCVAVRSVFDVSGFEIRLAVFADGKGRIIGFEAKLKVGNNRLSVLADLEAEPEVAGGKLPESAFGFKFEASLDAIKLLEGSVISNDNTNRHDEMSVTPKVSGLSIDAKPGKLLESLIGRNDGSINMRFRSENEKQFEFSVSYIVNKVSWLALRTAIYEPKSSPDRIGTGEVTDISKLNILDYGDITVITNFLLDRIETIDEQGLRNIVDSYIKKYVNESFGYNMIREFWNNGMLPRVLSVLTGDVSSNVFTPPTPEQLAAAAAENNKAGDMSGNPGDASGQASDALAETGDEGITGPGKTGEGAVSEEGSAGENDSSQNKGDTGSSSGAVGESGNEGSTQGEEKNDSAGQAVDGSGNNSATPEEIEKKKNEFLAQYKYSFPIETDDPVADRGDEVVMDIVPIIAGMPYNEASYSDCYAYLGEDWYGEGLDEKIIGAKIGDVIDVEATLGDSFGLFSGYHGKFRVTVTDIHKYVRPEWTEAFIVDRLGYKSLEACEKKLLDGA